MRRIEHHARYIQQILGGQPAQDTPGAAAPTPARDQITKRRYTVDFEAPKHGGRACQAHPLTST
ncbi:hypothetical protein Psi01_67210 [Planobispora siamensis]|uniref:Uncharacterized protein n=1 Tax=Planobispora siamensis TaxID=936338 RepID=A0A8J3WQR4_9ACTN|nr:hypothetical protein Psi01_67210 [Planobispora siamensis]